ncbi:MAG TPA: hypothetical protein VFZ98_12790 [Vicinamibacterales bacterium]
MSKPTFPQSLWSPRIALIALAVSLVLDYMEWVEHHPPVMALIVVLHFLFAWVSLAVVVWMWRRFSTRFS